MATAHPIHKRWLLVYLLICIFTARSSFSQSPSLASHLNSKLAPKTSSQAVPQAVSPAEGQGDQPAKATPKDEVILVDPLGRSTPYGCVIGFLQAVNGNDLPKAAQYLDTKLPEDQAEELAKQLKVVLDTGLSSSINGLSRETLGKLTDDLRVTREKVGVADTQDGNLDIFLDRISRQDAEPIWLFSAETLAQIPDAYAHLSRHDVSRFLPAFFVSLQLLGLPLWRWLVILIVVTGAIFLSSFVTRILFLLFGFFLNYRHVKDKKDILVRLKMPVTVLLLALAISSFEPYTLSVLSRHYWTIISRTMGLIGFAWFFVRLFDTVGIIATRHSIENGTREKIAVIVLARRLFKIFALLIVFLLLLKGAGINVSAMLAGLGIGGIALALAAQKTLEDLFGGISIIMRDSIRVGDSCRIADQTGTIEDIGLSSTRLRTQDRTVVSIPNAKIAQLSSENFGLRDKFLFHHMFPIRFETPREQIESSLASIQTLMTHTSGVERDSCRIRVIGIADASITIEAFAYIAASSFEAFLIAQQDLLLSILTNFAEFEAQLAFPSQTIYLESVAGGQAIVPLPHSGKGTHAAVPAAKPGTAGK